MNQRVESSNKMSEAWAKMAKGPGLGFYLEMDDVLFLQIKDVSGKKRLPDSISCLPGITDIVTYIRALNNYLKG